ncbi:hypothetical protein EDD37DRAFT_635353 [Exophiala viscosa]|uniref:uncharacterized protein n=1 Tax=Exophiala viscosa TaxID=2486360 RepID=UPI00219B95FF|nr:hypothetical protein EDD37DRAFT_635353 [Exophiala viscosa]
MHLVYCLLAVMLLTVYSLFQFISIAGFGQTPSDLSTYRMYRYILDASATQLHVQSLHNTLSLRLYITRLPQ